MPINIVWKQEFQVAGGPSGSATESMTVEAYDTLDVKLTNDPEGQMVSLQPGTDDVHFLLISSSRYDAGITYKLDPDSEDSYPLDGQVLLAKGGIKLLGKAPQTLLFKNPLSEEIPVRVVVGRDATPPPDIT